MDALDGEEGDGQTVFIDTTTNLEDFRMFLIYSTCHSFIPESYAEDEEIFPEKEGEQGSIYVEAADKVTLKKIREITFINASDVLGILYTSKSGNTKLKWRQIKGTTGRLSGEASTNSVVNLITARAITQEYAMQLAKVKKPQEEKIQEAVPQVQKTEPPSGEDVTEEVESQEEESVFSAGEI